MYSVLEEKEIDRLLINRDYETAEGVLLASLKKRPGSIGLLRMLLRLLELNCSERLLDIAEGEITAALVSWFKSGISDNRLLSILSTFNSRLMKVAIENELHPLENLKPLKVSKRPKIVILTCLWKRLELTKEFLRYYAILKEELERYLELDLVAVGSEGLLTRELTEAYGFHYVEAPNKPLSDKWQKGLSFSSRIEFDALVILGSDDFLNKSTFFNYISMLRKGVVFYGFYDAYVYDSVEKDLMYWPGYSDVKSKMPQRTGETVGMGRMLHRNVLELLDFDLWKGIQVNSSLDGYAQRKLKKSLMLLPVHSDKIATAASIKGNKIAQVGTTLKAQDLFAVDIKGKSNVTDPNALRKVSHISDPATSKGLMITNFGLELSGKFHRLTNIKVSIIILAHKESDFLSKAIESALSQKFDYDYEVILASDSEPKLEKVAKRYGVKFSLSTKDEDNSSCSKNLNDAVSCARGDFVKLAAYDDFLPEDCIQNLYEIAVKENSSLVFANAFEYYSEGKIKKYRPSEKTVTIESQAKKNIIHGGTIMFNRKDFLVAGGLNQNIIYAEEFDFYFKLLVKKLNFSYVDKFVYYYRRHEGQKGTLSLDQKSKERKAKLVSCLGQHYLNKENNNSLTENLDNKKIVTIGGTRKKIVAGLATIESRKNALIKVVDSIYKQVDELNIYQNGYKDTSFICDPDNKVNIVSSIDTSIDKGDAGKFYFVDNSKNCLYFSLDDDLLYPKDYVSRSIDFMQRNPECSVFSYHGKIFKPNASDWFREILVNVRCTDEYLETHDVQFGGTGVMFFDTSDFNLSFKDFEKENMADVFVGLKALSCGKRIVALPHEKDWVSIVPEALAPAIRDNTIYRKRKVQFENTLQSDESRYLRRFFSQLNPCYES
ncbi:glycosyltransferase [Idiomarina sp. Sol25]|uniref:glycosyltransferase family 2 protein n=1 Tax=Idiomarina sp. Sol25 TaxID=3064000 RepID=UPI00294AEE69|nr:glycosyltransferase [Idiomarina sp. Sol25]MDV6328080.1 glycosyltransferase [Idiomarina sp. Sol25]